MNLAGWDIAAAVDVARLNRARAHGPSQRLSVAVEGLTFSALVRPWKLLGPGAGRRLRFVFPLSEVQSSGGNGNVGASHLVADLAIHLEDGAAGGGRRLLLDLRGRTATPRQVRIVGTDPGMPSETERALGAALLAGLSSEPADFATLATIAGGDALADLPRRSWAWLPGPIAEPSGDAEGCLVLLAAAEPRRDGAAASMLDRRLAGRGARATFALSHRLFYERALLPWLEEDCPLQAPFDLSADGIRMERLVRLPSRVHGGLLLDFWLRDVHLHRAGGSLNARIRAATRVVGHPVILHTELSYDLPFRFDRNTGRFAFGSGAPEPAARSWSRDSRGWMNLHQPIVALLRDEIDHNVTAMAAATARRLDALLSTARTLKWSGHDTFDADWAAFEGGVLIGQGGTPVASAANSDAGGIRTVLKLPGRAVT